MQLGQNIGRSQKPEWQPHINQCGGAVRQQAARDRQDVCSGRSQRRGHLNIYCRQRTSVLDSAHEVLTGIRPPRRHFTQGQRGPVRDLRQTERFDIRALGSIVTSLKASNNVLIGAMADGVAHL